jgi:hypothetical protein
MAEDHEEWLRKQGVKIIGRNTLHRASMPSYRDWAQGGDMSIDFGPMDIKTEQVYQVEMCERTIENLRRNDSMLTSAMEHAGRLTRQGILNSNSVGQYFIDNSRRHHELIKENAMYRDAWKEFQTIRVLLGETPHWP